MRLAVTLLLLWPIRVLAQDCEALPARAGAPAGLPEGLLPAIARAEAGRGSGAARRAWPWTLNQGGKAMYFDTEAAALSYLSAAVAVGVTNIDVGCMQLNYRWHSAAFAALQDMLEPARNVAYAAGFVANLQAETGSWEAATAAYHSRDPVRGAAYADRVARLQTAGGTPGTVEDRPGQPADMPGFAAGWPPELPPELPMDLRTTTGQPLIAGPGEPLIAPGA